jgi:bleomycin hydrolase
LTIISALHAQTDRRDRAVFVVPKNEFMDSVHARLDRFRHQPVIPHKALRPDFAAFNPPATVEAFTSQWHNVPVSQALSGMCWCYSATSFFESEIHRLTNRNVKLSELYTVYWEYVEKARGFVRSRGTTTFGEGSQGAAVIRSFRLNGIVPAEAYTGLLNGQPYHDHEKLFEEMRVYLQGLKVSNAWDEEEVVRTIRSILDHYIGAPPATVTVDGKAMTPKEYFEKVVRLNLGDYVAFCSFMDRPFYQPTEYDVSDNWWHGREYINVPLTDYMAALKSAVRAGYTVTIWGDVSEPGLEGHAGIAVVPSFDIPSSYIDESARQFRYMNGTTGDDHGVHIVGYTEKDGKDWYLIKDSGSGSRNNGHPGYYFFHEDYVKLKMLGFLVHKSAVPELVKKLTK